MPVIATLPQITSLLSRSALSGNMRAHAPSDLKRRTWQYLLTGRLKPSGATLLKVLAAAHAVDPEIVGLHCDGMVVFLPGTAESLIAELLTMRERERREYRRLVAEGRITPRELPVFRRHASTL